MLRETKGSKLSTSSFRFFGEEGVVFQGMTSSRSCCKRKCCCQERNGKGEGVAELQWKKGGEYPLVDLVSHGKKGRKRNQQIEQPRETKKM